MPSKAWGDDFEIMLFGDEAPRAPFTEEGEYAVVEICGPLTQKPGWWGESYDEIRSRVVAALASPARKVCLRIDSPGGDYGGVLELSRELRSLAGAAGKPIVAFTDGMALSAGYAIACAAEEIVTTASAQVGSVGVWAPLVDVTAQDAMYGVKYVVAASGKAKNDRNPHTGITDESFARLQAQIEDMALNFFALVSDQRPALSVADVKALEGAEFFGMRGVQAGLSDRVVNSWQAFLANEEGSPMGVKAGAIDEARGLLQKASEGDDEDAKKAKKLLKAFEEPSEEDKKKEEEEKAAAKAAEDEKEKEKEGEKDAKALAIKLSGELSELKSKIAARDEADAKAKADAELLSFFATRPDLSADQRKSLDGLPLERVKAIVSGWPRVTARPGASAAASLPAVTGGERQTPDRTMSAEEQAIFDRTDPFKRQKTSAKASFKGSEFTMPARMITNEEAAARVAELEKEFGGTP